MKEKSINLYTPANEFKPVPKNNLFIYTKKEINDDPVKGFTIIIDLIQQQYMLFLERTDGYYMLSTTNLNYNKNKLIHFELGSMVDGLRAIYVDVPMLKGELGNILSLIKMVESDSEIHNYDLDVKFAWDIVKEKMSPAAKSAIKQITDLE